ncbi:hypothetical protein QR98_0061940 [Sarcoptes scabiei]|uniref:Uncharacterized protein n=1 Tax=Sarcoptes scabiei TaxID=52283 RepID=A0A132AAS8_SARSC|nr:hypothetical protein QR98_0061940 [Sarcoptes scabiei]
MDSDHWIRMLKIFDSFTNTKSVEFVSIFSNLMLHKCSNLPLDSEYREVYLFLAKLLKGELPNIQNLKPKSTSILLALIQEIQLLVDSIEAKDVERIFAKNDQVNLEKSSHEEIPEERREKLMKTLMTMFKFQKISHFLNPLKIPHEVNRELMGYFLKKVA